MAYDPRNQQPEFNARADEAFQCNFYLGIHHAPYSVWDPIYSQGLAYEAAAFMNDEALGEALEHEPGGGSSDSSGGSSRPTATSILTHSDPSGGDAPSASIQEGADVVPSLLLLTYHPDDKVPMPSPNK